TLRLCSQRRLKAAQHAVHKPLHAHISQSACTKQGADVVDDVEWAGASVQEGGEPPRCAVREAREPPDQPTEVPHEQVPEENVEEQLLVVPLRTVGGLAKLGNRCSVEQF